MVWREALTRWSHICARTAGSRSPARSAWIMAIPLTPVISLSTWWRCRFFGRAPAACAVQGWWQSEPDCHGVAASTAPHLPLVRAERRRAAIPPRVDTAAIDNQPHPAFVPEHVYV